MLPQAIYIKLYFSQDVMVLCFQCAVSRWCYLLLIALLVANKIRLHSVFSLFPTLPQACWLLFLIHLVITFRETLNERSLQWFNGLFIVTWTDTEKYLFFSACYPSNHMIHKYNRSSCGVIESRHIPALFSTSKSHKHPNWA